MKDEILSKHVDIINLMNRHKLKLHQAISISSGENFDEIGKQIGKKIRRDKKVIRREIVEYEEKHSRLIDKADKVLRHIQDLYIELEEK